MAIIGVPASASRVLTTEPCRSVRSRSGRDSRRLRMSENADDAAGGCPRQRYRLTAQLLVGSGTRAGWAEMIEA